MSREKKHTQKIPDDVLGFLRQCDLQDGRLKLPENEGTTAKLYASLKKSILRMGGKYQRGGYFTFADVDQVRRCIETGEFLHNKGLRQAFYTPEPVADKAASLLRCEGLVVFEPSIGGGALAKAALKAGAKCVIGADIDAGAVAEVNQMDNVSAVVADFVNYASTVQQPGFSRILMNPPFDSGQAMKHTLLAVNCLADRGILVAILPATFDFGALHASVQPRGGHVRVFPLPPNSFKKSGTAVSTKLAQVVLNAAGPCEGCPFGDSEASEKAQNWGCLPEPHRILESYDAQGKEWQCHSNETTPCRGLARLRPTGAGYPITPGDWADGKDSLETPVPEISAPPKPEHVPSFSFDEAEMVLSSDGDFYRSLDNAVKGLRSTLNRTLRKLSELHRESFDDNEDPDGWHKHHAPAEHQFPLDLRNELLRHYVLKQLDEDIQESISKQQA